MDLGRTKGGGEYQRNPFRGPRRLLRLLLAMPDIYSGYYFFLLKKSTYQNWSNSGNRLIFLNGDDDGSKFSCVPVGLGGS